MLSREKDEDGVAEMLGLEETAFKYPLFLAKLLPMSMFTKRPFCERTKVL